jgi:hypothetical protein
VAWVFPARSSGTGCARRVTPGVPRTTRCTRPALGHYGGEVGAAGGSARRRHDGCAT